MEKTGQIQKKRDSTEFKIGVTRNMREHSLGYRETARKH